LRAQGIAAKALLVGDGMMRGEVESRARALAVDQHVAIAGFREDVRPYLSACDVVVVCSLTEALSLAAIEAMAMGKPLVHSDVGGVAELIEAGRTGLLFPAGDTAAMVECLLHLVDREAALKMGRDARGTAESVFGEDQMVSGYERLLSELCESGRATLA
jgi:glycosyltransferase involved in cell wall biosynthesis